MRTIQVNDKLDESKLNRFHFTVVCWCFFIIMLDGYDLIVYGSIMPVLMDEWKMSGIVAGSIQSYTLIGMMLGALIFGTLADKIGRRNVIIISTCLFSLLSIVTSLATNPVELGIYRFITGLGLGGSLPNVFALTAEYAPKRYRHAIVGVMSGGYAIGGILAASLSIQLIPLFGWQSLFISGGILLLCVPLMFAFMPESMNYYVQRKHKQVPHILKKIDPSYIPQSGDKFELRIPEKSHLPVLNLFQDGRALQTIMIWIVCFMNLMMLFGLNTWLPKLMLSAGYPLGSSLVFLLVLNIGAIFGPIFGGWFGDRWKLKYVLIIYFILAAISILLLIFKTKMILLYFLVFIAGASTTGSQPLTNSFITQLYPFNMQATALGWALGIGRVGAILGTSLSGLIVSLHLSFHMNFIVFAIPGFIAAFALLFIFEKDYSS